jgi:hypothetical protein
MNESNMLYEFVHKFLIGQDLQHLMFVGMCPILLCRIPDGIG